MVNILIYITPKLLVSIYDIAYILHTMAVSCWRKQLEIDFDGGHLQTEAVFGWDLHNGFTVVATLNLDGDIGQVCTY